MASTISDQFRLLLTRGAVYFFVIAICVPSELVEKLNFGKRPLLVPLATVGIILAWGVGRIAVRHVLLKKAYLTIWLLIIMFLGWAVFVSVLSPMTEQSLTLVGVYLTRFAFVFVLIQLLAIDPTLLQRAWRLLPVVLALLILASFTGIINVGNARQTAAEGISIIRESVGLGDPNFTALILNVGVASALTWVATEKRFLRRCTIVACVLTLVIGVGRTVSIGGLSGLLLIIALTWKKILPRSGARRWLLAVVSGGLIVVIITIAGVAYHARVQAQIQRGQVGVASVGSERLNLMIGGVRMALSKPLTGVGPANVATQMPSFLLFPIFKPNQGAHNLAIEVADETGFPAAFMLVLIFYYAFRLLRGGRKRADNIGFRPGYLLGSGLEIALIATFVQSAALSSQRFPILWLLIALAMAYPVAQERQLVRRYRPQSQMR